MLILFFVIKISEITVSVQDITKISSHDGFWRVSRFHKDDLYFHGQGSNGRENTTLSKLLTYSQFFATEGNKSVHLLCTLCLQISTDICHNLWLIWMLFCFKKCFVPLDNGHHLFSSCLTCAASFRISR